LNNEGSIFCDTCKNINIRCKICNEFIEKEEMMGQLEPCGYIFHREHIADWIADQDYCPICFQKIGGIDLDATDEMRK